MTLMKEGQGERDYRMGLRELSAHRPDKALRLLRSAVEACPASRPSELSARLYWMALALLQLDRSELALKSLASAQKLRPRGHARKAYLARINDYGMSRRASPDLDDFYAFYSIQVCAFLSRKPGRRFSSEDEKDAITRLLAGAWQDLRTKRKLAELTIAQKLELFRVPGGAFPDFVVGGLSHGKTPRPGAAPGRTISVDFRRGRASGPEDSCSCGSGLPFRLCCGRLDSFSCRG